MKYYLVLFNILIVLNTNVAHSTELTPAFAKEIGVKVERHSLPAEYNASCSIIDITSPVTLPNYSEYDELSVVVEVFSNNGVLMSSTYLYTMIDSPESHYISSGCLPINNKHVVKVTLRYSLKEAMCAKDLSISNLEEWVIQ